MIEEAVRGLGPRARATGAAHWRWNAQKNRAPRSTAGASGAHRAVGLGAELLPGSVRRGRGRPAPARLAQCRKSVISIGAASTAGPALRAARCVNDTARAGGNSIKLRRSSSSSATRQPMSWSRPRASRQSSHAATSRDKPVRVSVSSPRTRHRMRSTIASGISRPQICMGRALRKAEARVARRVCGGG